MTPPATQTVRFHAPVHDVHIMAGSPRGLQSTAPDEDEKEIEQERVKPVEQPKQQTEANSLLQQISAQLVGIEELRQQQVFELQRVAVELAVAVAAHVLKKTIDANEFQLEELVQSAVEQLHLHEQTKIYVNGEDKEYLESLPQERLGVLAEQAEIVEDPQMPRGSCRVFAGEHGLLSRMDTRLEDLRHSLLEGIEYARADR